MTAFLGKYAANERTPLDKDVLYALINDIKVDFLDIDNDTKLDDYFVDIGEFEDYRYDFTIDEKQKRKEQIKVIKGNLKKKMSNLYKQKVFKCTDTNNKFWFSKVLKYITDYYNNSQNFTLKKLKNRYVLKYITDMIDNYVTLKYMDMGKAIYIFVERH